MSIILCIWFIILTISINILLLILSLHFNVIFLILFYWSLIIQNFNISFFFTTLFTFHFSLIIVIWLICSYSSNSITMFNFFQFWWLNNLFSMNHHVILEKILWRIWIIILWIISIISSLISFIATKLILINDLSFFWINYNYFLFSFIFWVFIRLIFTVYIIAINNSSSITNNMITLL